MRNKKRLALIVMLVAAPVLALALYLVSTYSISTSYASEVPTATQTVKVCHNSCRYLAPAVAFKLKLGLVLSGIAGLTIVGAANVLRSKER